MTDANQILEPSLFQGYWEAKDCPVSDLMGYFHQNNILINHLCMFSYADGNTPYLNLSFVPQRIKRSKVRPLGFVETGLVQEREFPSAENLYNFLENHPVKAMFTESAALRDFILTFEPYADYERQAEYVAQQMPDELEDWLVKSKRAAGLIRRSFANGENPNPLEEVLKPLARHDQKTDGFTLPATVWVVSCQPEQQLFLAVWDDDIPKLQRLYGDEVQTIYGYWFTPHPDRQVEQRLESVWTAFNTLLANLDIGPSVEAVYRSVFSFPTEGMNAKILYAT